MAPPSEDATAPSEPHRHAPSPQAMSTPPRDWRLGPASRWRRGAEGWVS